MKAGDGEAARRFFRPFVEPSPRITDPEERRRARLNSSLSLVLLIGAVASSLIEESAYGFFRDMDAAHFVILFGLLALVGAYGLSRTRHHTLSAVLTVYTLSTLVWRLWAVTVVEEPTNDTLYFIALPLILSALLLPLTYTLVFVGLTLASILLIPSFAAALGAPVERDLVFNLAVFVVLVSSLTIAAATLVDRARRQLAAQAVKLREQTEATESANQQLRDLEASRIRFLNQAAHDLAQPLTPVKIQVELIRIADAEDPDPRVGESIQMIERNLGLFEHLLQDIRDLAKMDAGQLRLEPTQVRLRDVAAEVCDFYKPVAEDAGVRIDLDVPEDLTAWADRRRLEQVLNNLVANAIRFSPTWAATTVRARSAPEGVEVRVTDKGRGLTGDEIGRLFRPFSQVHERSEVKERGTGLGLYICKGFVEAHGGRIWVESQGRGHGSTFAFTLPTTGAKK
jgi:signal transduction histidine kinase